MKIKIYKFEFNFCFRFLKDVDKTRCLKCKYLEKELSKFNGQKMILFHKHIWTEEVREKMYRDNRYDYFTGQYNENALPSNVYLV